MIFKINYMNKKNLKSFAIVLVFILISYHFFTAVNFDNIKYVKIAGQRIKVDLALTREAQEQGFSGRNELKENEGMLFVFDKPGKYSFWMKDMNFPIDIIWIGEDLKVVYIKKSALPELYPETYGPQNVPTQIGIPTPVGTKYVLEVVSGFSEKNNLKIGDSVEFL